MNRAGQQATEEEGRVWDSVSFSLAVGKVASSSGLVGSESPRVGGRVDWKASLSIPDSLICTVE